MTFYLNRIDFSVSKNAIFVVTSFNYSQKDALFCWYWHTVSGEQTTICYFTSTSLWFSFLRLADIERILLGRHQNVEIIPDSQSDKRTYWIRTTGDQNSSFRLSAQKKDKSIHENIVQMHDMTYKLLIYCRILCLWKPDLELAHIESVLVCCSSFKFCYSNCLVCPFRVDTKDKKYQKYQKYF